MRNKKQDRERKSNTIYWFTNSTIKWWIFDWIFNKSQKRNTKRFRQNSSKGISGVILGIPVGSIAYNYAKNLPSSHNYITVEEAKKGITNRKDHDSSKYKKYLMERFDLTEEEAEERIQREEEGRKWER